MGTPSGSEIDAWLAAGGIVIAASDRAARALTAAHHRARQSEGLSAWPAPQIFDWRIFARTQWSALDSQGRLLLTATQERSLWTQIVRQSETPATVLAGPRRRIAALAMEAHELLADYSPRHMQSSPRHGWQRDAAAFSAWLSAFDKLCSKENLVSATRVPLELAPLLASDSASRPPLLLVGFDRILPAQRALFDAWSTWRAADLPESATGPHFYRATDAQTELAACARWCMLKLAANPQARLLVITQQIAARRGEIERAFLAAAPSASPLFEFTLGVPLAQVPLARSAHLLLRWLTEPIDESELDWLLSTDHSAASPRESAALRRRMRELRLRSLEQPSWPLDTFLRNLPMSDSATESWSARISSAVRRLRSHELLDRTPLDWAELVPRLLADIGWPGFPALTSSTFQSAERWQQAVDSSASLGFLGSRIGWPDFLSELRHTLDESLFAPESRNAPIQIAGPAEAAGLTADALWFLGAAEDTWPAPGAPHPFLPPHVQREAQMPHAAPHLDWDLAHAITARLLTQAPEVCFSYARQNADAELRPSRLITAVAGPPQPLPADLALPAHPRPLAVRVLDASRVPLSLTIASGGSNLLSTQSKCAFQAFATTRLRARRIEPAEAGLTPKQRGIWLHAVLNSVWSKNSFDPPGLRTLADLRALPDRRTFVASHVRHVLAVQISPDLRDRMPARYLELEGERLTHLVTAWLNYESTRLPFTVAETEAQRTIHLAGVAFSVRLDRLDQLNDGSVFVIDYKSSDVETRAWDTERPEDIQLPLYACFALSPEEQLGGLAFAKVRPQERTFAGRAINASATLFPGNKGAILRPHNRLSRDQLTDWRDLIENLAADFVSGRAVADPRDERETCDRCRLHTLCRIADLRIITEDEEEELEDAADD